MSVATSVAFEKTVVFEKMLSGIGLFSLRPLIIEQDAEILTDWVNRDYAVYWGMQHTRQQQVSEFYQALLLKRPGSVFMGIFEQQPTFLLECYQAREDLVGNYYPAQPDDHGMHLLVAPARTPIANFTWGVFQTVIEFIFSDQAIHRLNKRAGFVYQHTIELPNKRAWLAFCTREQYAQAQQQEEHQLTAVP